MAVTATGFVMPTWQGADTLSGTAWSNPTAILVNDDTETIEAIATMSVPGTGSLTGGWMKLGNFGFDSLIPVNAAILKVEIQVRSRVNSTGGIANREMAWWMDSARGTNVHTSVTEPTVLETVTYDVTSERAWTQNDLRDVVFQVHVRGRNGNSSTDPSYRYAWVKVQVTWDTPPDPPIWEDVMDDFNRPDAKINLGDGVNIWWTNGFDQFGQAVQVISNQMGLLAAQSNRPFLQFPSPGGQGFTGDFDYILDVPVVATSSSFHMCFAIQGAGTSTYDCYSVEWTQVTGLAPKFHKFVDGVSSDPTVIYSAPCGVNAGDSVWVARRGTRITAYRKPSGSSTWTKYLEAEAPDYITGWLGMAFSSATTRWDNIRGGPIGPQPPRNTAIPVISNLPIEGNPLSVSTGTWANTPTGYTYQWRKNGVNIGGATNNIYVCLTSDIGSSISCVVTATNAQGSKAATANSVVILVGPDQTIIDDFNRADGLLYAGAGAAIWTPNTFEGGNTPRVRSNQLGISLNPGSGSEDGLVSVNMLARDFDLSLDLPVWEEFTQATIHFCALAWGSQSIVDGTELYMGGSWVLRDNVPGTGTVTLLSTSEPAGFNLGTSGASVWITKRSSTITVYYRLSGGAWTQHLKATNATRYDRPGYFGLNLGDYSSQNTRGDNLRGGPIYYPPIPIVSVV